MRTIYLTAGHNGKGTGASSQYGDEGEEAIDVRDDVAELLQHWGVRVRTDPNRMRLRDVLRWVSGASKNDVICDIHFNAFNGKAHGTEVLIANEHNYKEKQLAQALCDRICSDLGTYNRGVKTERQTARKRIGILSGAPRHAINVLIEICFIDNESDMQKYDENYDDLIEGIADVLCDFPTE